MIVPERDLISALRQYNPWWTGGAMTDLPGWRRAAFREVNAWLTDPPAQRALLLSGARQIGKTTLLLQALEARLKAGVPAANVLYATLDHPLLKLVGLDGILKLWRETEPAAPGPEYLFLDEIQYARDWQTWLKLQVDFQKKRRIAVTGSATPLVMEGQESGVGRWHTVRLATLSFFEYLQIRRAHVPDLPALPSLSALQTWDQSDFQRTAAIAAPMTGLFHDYLLRGGFPQAALTESLTLAQKLLREDIVDKVLKRDMTALFGVRRVLELEQLFLYLCLHDGGLVDMTGLCNNLQIKKPTVSSFLDLLEATHLIHRLLPHGYGKEVLRGRAKIYLADAAIAPSVLLKGKSLMDDPAALGQAVETAFFKHVFTRHYAQNVKFSYWRGRGDTDVDIIAELGTRLVPFEVKYRHTATGAGDLKGMRQFCSERKVPLGYVITRELDDFGPLILQAGDKPLTLLKIPASLACYWLGRSELESKTAD